jgi:hypothetical protein
MDALMRLFRRLLFYLRRGRFERELEEEVQFHLEMRARENAAAGMTEAEALQLARRRFGNETLLREESREVWGFRSLESVVQDISFGARVMMKRPGFTAVAALTLALGIGANTAIFSVTNAVLLRQLPYSEPERLVHLVSVNAGRGIERGSIPYADFIDWRDQSGLFERIVLYTAEKPTIIGDADPERITAVVVSEGYFEMIGANPLLGRTFTPEEHQPGPGGVVVISRGLWQRRYGGDPNIVGRTISFGGPPYTIIGVVDQAAVWPTEAQLWIPLGFGPNETDMRHDNMIWQALGRLKRDVTLTHAKARLATMAEDRTRLPGIAQRLEFRCNPTARVCGRSQARSGDPGAARGGNVYAADCMRECGKPSARALGYARA